MVRDNIRLIEADNDDDSQIAVYTLCRVEEPHGDLDKFHTIAVCSKEYADSVGLQADEYITL